MPYDPTELQRLGVAFAGLAEWLIDGQGPDWLPPGVFDTIVERTKEIGEDLLIPHSDGTIGHLSDAASSCVEQAIREAGGASASPEPLLDRLRAKAAAATAASAPVSAPATSSAPVPAPTPAPPATSSPTGTTGGRASSSGGRKRPSSGGRTRS